MLNMLPAAIQVTLSTDSPTILQSGGECIRSYVSVAPDQVVAFTDNTGKSGLLHVLAVAEHTPCAQATLPPQSQTPL